MFENNQILKMFKEHLTFKMFEKHLTLKMFENHLTLETSVHVDAIFQFPRRNNICNKS